MAIYTGIADANGDFNISFGVNYTAGQKVTVTAEKDAATKTIELYAPSSVVGGGLITWTGTVVNFPRNIGVVTIETGVNAAIADKAFWTRAADPSFGYHATGLKILGATSIGAQAFDGWETMTDLFVSNTVTTIANYAFANSAALKNIDIGTGVTSLGTAAFTAGNLTKLTVRATTPPTYGANAFNGMNQSVSIYVPAASVNAYKAAAGWSSFASRIFAIP